MANESETNTAIKTMALELGVDELFKRWKAAESELARVRGLLQRQSEALEAWLQVFYPVEGMGLAPLDYGLKEDVVRLVKQSRKALSRRTLGN